MRFCVSRRFKTFFSSAAILSLSAPISTQAVNFVTLYLAKIEDAEKAYKNIKSGKDSIFPYVFNFYQHYKLFIGEWRVAIYFQVVKSKNKNITIFFYENEAILDTERKEIFSSGKYNTENKILWMPEYIFRKVKKEDFERACKMIVDYSRGFGKKWEKLLDSGYFDSQNYQSWNTQC